MTSWWSGSIALRNAGRALRDNEPALWLAGIDLDCVDAETRNDATREPARPHDRVRAVRGTDREGLSRADLGEAA